MKLSVCLIVRDEERTLPRLLPSVREFADEIVIVDTGSTDGTAKVIDKYADKKGKFGWCDDFAAARNYAFSLATGELLMWLDADDIIPDSSVEKLKKLKDDPPDCAAIYMPYVTAFDESEKPTFSFLRERIVRRAASPRWVGRVHEVLTYRGGRSSLDIPVHHRSAKSGYSTRNLDIYLAMEREGAAFSARDVYYFGRELYYHGRYDEAIERLTQAVENEAAWVEDRVSACRFLSMSYGAMGKGKEAIDALYRTFEFAPLRPDLACDIGKQLFANGRISHCTPWYRAAFFLPLPTSGFVDATCIGYTPALGLCVAYDRLGDHITASAFNDLAGLYDPLGKAYLYNLSYFGGLGISPIDSPRHILIPEVLLAAPTSEGEYHEEK